MKGKYKTRFFIVIAVAIFTIIVAYMAFRGNYLETMEIGKNYITVFWQNIKYMSITLIINFSIIYIAVYTVNLSIKRGLQKFFDQEKKQMPKLLNKSIAFISAIVVSSITTSYILEKAMLCFNSAQFGMQDPIFNTDIGYFVFQKPFIELVIWYFIILFVALTVYTVAYYIISFNIFFNGGVDRKTLKNSKFIKQLTKFTFIIAVLISMLMLIKTQDIGTQKFLNLQAGQTSYSLYGAGFTDVTIKLWGYRILAIVIVVSIYMAIKAFNKGDKKKLILNVAIVPTYLVGMFFIMVAFQTIFVSTNELDKEKQYIEANIRYTKNAYGVNIEEVSLNNSVENINSEDLLKYQNVLNNVSIVSKDVVLKDLNNGQTAKGYYSYKNSQIGKYNINGKEQLVYISPREIANNGETYNNKTYEYTHGYGAIITSANSTSENGTLDHIQKGFNTSNEVIEIKEPRIYFGTQTNSTAVINADEKKEFDYPILDSSAATNAENSYEGTAGLSLNFIDRMILAIKEGDIKLAFSSNVTGKSKILTNRNIIKRAKAVMPYLMYDQNPYLVITAEGKLVWILDAYTISNCYPYSQKITIRESSTTKFELNYIRNSVKVLIDAYDGTINFYITDRNDPIAMAYRNIYSGLFVDLDTQIPADIANHLVYPEYLYNIQAEIVSRYHNIQPDVLYRNDDIWEIATHNAGKVITKTGTDIAPYYTMVKLQNENNSQLGLVLPYTPVGRQNLISYLVGSYDNSGTSKLTIYKYQVDSNILGPMQLDTQIEQDEIITNEIETLNANGIKVTKNMLITPLDNTLLYIEPIYTQYINEADALPTLKKVIVASSNKVAIGNNLQETLTNLISQNAVDIEVENTDTVNDIIDTIIKANKNLTNSNASNNWEMMGKDVQKLQELIQKLEILVEEENKIKNEIEASQTNANIIANEIDMATNEISNVVE